MKTVEDCLEALDNQLMRFVYTPPPGYVHPSDAMTDWDQKFVSDVSTHTQMGSALSTAQAKVVLKILRRYSYLMADTAKVESICDAETYRQELFQSVEFPREVRYLGATDLVFRFKYNPHIALEFKNIEHELPGLFKSEVLHPWKIWRVTVDSSNYKNVMEIIKRHAFNFDEDVLNMFMKIANNTNRQNTIEIQEDKIVVDMNDDLLMVTLLQEMAWLKDV